MTDAPRAPSDLSAIVAPVDTVGAFVGDPRVLAVGERGGPLAGTTLAVKDVIDVAGTRTGAGNPTFGREQPLATANARAVQLLVAAGSTVIGKTVTDELAYSLSGTNVHYGTPVNTAAPDRVPGGSSAGSAAAVAAGLCDIALGTDTGGSIRVPASYCGIFGWRPSHGAVSSAGIVHLARSFDTVGLLTRSLPLLALAADVLLDGATASAPSSRTEISSAIRVVELLELAGTDARTSVRTATGAFTEANELELGVDLAAAADAFRVLQGSEAWVEHGAWITAAAPAMGPGISARFAAAALVPSEEVAGAELVRAGVRRAVVDATASGRVLVGPAAAGAAPRLDTAVAARRAVTLQLTCLAGLAGAPVVVLPVARDEGLPLGVACVGAPGSDLPLLAWAATQFPGSEWR